MRRDELDRWAWVWNRKQMKFVESINSKLLRSTSFRAIEIQLSLNLFRNSSRLWAGTAASSDVTLKWRLSLHALNYVVVNTIMMKADAALENSVNSQTALCER